MKIIKVILLTYLMAGTTFLTGGCGFATSEVSITRRDNGRQVELNRGQTLIVSLSGNPSTGYLWQLGEVDEHILQQTEAKFEQKSDRVGASGLQIFYYKAIGTGETVLKLVYRRPWEKNVEPLETFYVQVIVR